MTSLRCQRCGRYWSMTTNWPDSHPVTSRWCPICIPHIMPMADVLPLRGRR